MSDFAAKRTAAFLRLLAEELVPQNKLQELVGRLAEQLRYERQVPTDFTGVELRMAKAIGFTGQEVDEVCADRITMWKEASDAAAKRAEAAWDYQRAEEAKVSGLKDENRSLRSALEALGFPPKAKENV